MILTDDNFATIVKAVELGRGLYDNLTKYIRFQMGVLVGFIVTFLGASIFNILGGVPFVPLQTLYVNFTTQVLQAIGLGYGRPAEGLMKRKPRASDEQILPRPLLIWVAIAGFVMGGATLLLIAWAHDHYDSGQIARTMGLTSFAFSNVAFSWCTRDERSSVFSLGVLEDRTFLLCTGRLARRDPARHRARAPPADPPHGAPRPAPVAPVPRRRARDRPGVRGEAPPARSTRPGRRAGGARHHDGLIARNAGK